MCYWGLRDGVQFEELKCVFRRSLVGALGCLKTIDLVDSMRLLPWLVVVVSFSNGRGDLYERDVLLCVVRLISILLYFFPSLSLRFILFPVIILDPRYYSP